jgi:hypothetical protein
MARRKKDTRQIIPDEYKNLDDEELSRLKRIGDAMQSVEKGRIQEIKAQEAGRNVIETKVAILIVTNVFSKLKNILYSSSNKLPAQIAGKEHAEITQIMFSFIDESLEKCQQDFENKLSNIKIDDIGEGEDD